MGTFLQDFRYGLRGLRRNPILAIIAVVSLGLGIGATMTAYTWFDRFILRPLPVVPDAHELVAINTRAPGGDEWSVSLPSLRDWRAQSTTTDIAGGAGTQFGLRVGEGTERIWAMGVTWNFFDVLGFQPLAGRWFRPEEERPGAGPVAVLGYSFWQQRFTGDSGIVGRSITLNGTPITVVGIAPPRFGGAVIGLTFDIYIPIGMSHVLRGGPDPTEQRGWQFMNVFGRRRPGVSLAQARAEVDMVAKRAATAAGGDTADRLGAVVKPFADNGPGEFLKPILAALLGITGVLLLIACANVANLLLSRASARQREIAVRLAVGSGRARLVRQLLTESLVLAALAGLAGLLVSLWARDLMGIFIPPAPVPIIFDFQLNGHVLAFGLGVTVATALVFGLAPALQASRPDLVTALKDEIGSAPGGRGRLQAGLVVAQVALSLVTLVSAGLFIRSLALSRNVETGFRDTRQVLLVDTDTYIAGFRDSLGLPVARRLLETVRAVPGVEAAAIASDVPLGFGGYSSMSIEVPGYTPQADENMSVQYFNVSGDYFRTMRADILQGRAISDEDRQGGQRVAVVNETFARRYFAGRDAVGATFMQNGQPVTIVGLARDWRYRQLVEPARPFIYYAFDQRFWKEFVVHVRASGDPKALTGALRRAFQEVAADLPVLDVRTLREHTSASTFAQQLGAYMLSAFGLLALLLSAIGIYGVMAYNVSRRTREIGVRVALGATGPAVIRLVVGRAMRLAGIGLLIGGAAAIAAGQLLGSLLVGVSPYDPATFGVIVSVLGAVAFTASWIPARRAARIDPMVALRYE